MTLSHLSLRKHRPILRISIEIVSRHSASNEKEGFVKGHFVASTEKFGSLRPNGPESELFCTGDFVSASVWNVTNEIRSAIFFRVGPRFWRVNSAKENFCQTVATLMCTTVNFVVPSMPLLQTAQALFRP